MSDQGFRLDYHACREVLAKRLAEPAPGRIQLLAGPRQVGKTTLLLEMAEQAGKQAVYAAADAPEAALPGFWERVVGRAEDTAVVFVTHEINPILPYVDRVLYLVGGSGDLEAEIKAAE